MYNSTLCYLENAQGEYLMLHRVKKKVDINKGKWIGVGGRFEDGESPDECLCREVWEETGLTLTQFQFRGWLPSCAVTKIRTSSCTCSPPPAGRGS